MIYKMTLKDSADEMTFDLLEVPIVDKDIEGAVDNVTLDGNQYTDYLWLKKQFIQKWSILCDDEYTRLRGFYTRQFENADVPSYRLYYGDDIIRNSTLSGERIELSISGATDGTMSLTQMDGNIEQATYAGKNLFNATGGTTTVNGVTFTKNADGTYKANGKATAFIGYTIGKVTFTSATSVIYSGCPANGSTGTYSLNLQKDDGGVWLTDETGSGQTATLEANKAYNVRLIIRSGVTVNNIVYKPMVRLSSISDSSYEPYVGGVPAPNPQFPMPINTVTGRQTVTVAGKNIWNSGFVIGGIGSDGTNLNRADRYNSASFISVEPNTQYTFSATPKTAGKTAQVFFLAYDSRRSYIKQLPSNAWYNLPLTITTDQDTRYLKISGRYTDNTVFGTVGNATDALQNVQLELGSTATAFEPYEGQAHEINLGKNLLNAQGGFTNKIINSAGGESNSNPSALFDGYIAVSPSTQYTLSFKTPVNSMCVATYKADKTFVTRNIKNNASNYTLTTSADTHFVRIYFNYDNSTTVSQVIIDGLDIQLEKGYTASSYSPYFTPIELCKIGTYQDRIYKENGKWYLRKEIGRYDITGTESWSRSGRTTSTVFAGVLNGTALTNRIQIGADGGLSNRFLYMGNTTTEGAFDTYNWSGGIVTSLLFCLSTEKASDVASFKAWLTNNPTAFYYVLATPTTTEITNEAVLEELEALQDESISVGQHNIYTDTPNALPTLTLDLTEYLSKSTTIIPETAVRLTLTDGGVINACGCRKDVQLTMRETIE